MERAIRILIVDDDADFSAVLREVLQAEGCTVLEAADGKIALDILRTVALPQLILLDLMMPVMNGWDLYAELQRDSALAAIPIAVLSGVSRMRPFGLMHELHKPIDLPNFMGLLHAIEAPDQPSKAGRVHPS
jgi:CheY-like chemotaxis protein